LLHIASAPIKYSISKIGYKTVLLVTLNEEESMAAGTHEGFQKEAWPKVSDSMAHVKSIRDAK
jgi:hypothetical protein